MRECLLCKRDMKTSRDVFGNGCIKNIYSFLEMQMPRKVKLREKTLYKNVMRLNNIRNINLNKQIWLTDRYLTYQYLNRIPYGNHDELKEQINEEIKNIEKLNDNKEPQSVQNISLKQAYDLYKKVIIFQEGIKKLAKGNFTDEESIKVILLSFSFIFNISKNKNQYERNTYKAMQYVFWQAVIEIGGRYAEYDTAAYFLQHSLEEKPEDLYITEGKIVEEITKDNNFKETINKIINKYGNNNEFVFNSEVDKKIKMSFGDSDLYFAIHDVELNINGKKQEEKWKLDIRLHDKYDYSKRKRILEYYNDTNSIPKSILSSTLYNLAHYSMKFKVMKEYNIDIKFSIDNNFEVITK